jgi:hypothetical protein
VSLAWRAYDSVPRRRTRALLRLARPVLNPAFYPTAKVTSAYWWDGHHNFGDALTPWLLHQYGRIAVHTPPARAEMAGVGSILEQLPSEFSGTVWGSGLLFGERVDLPRARYAAVRGHLTKEIQGIRDPVALGDPGLLVARHASRPPRRWSLGVVPHGMHDGHPQLLAFAARYRRDVQIIGTRAPVSTVVRAIARCDAVISSSLHGVVIADSFGIPNAWFGLEPSLWGGSFKFADYESVVTPGRTRRAAVDGESSLTDVLSATTPAEPERVVMSMTELEASLGEVEARPLPPFLALSARDGSGRPNGSK